MNMYYMKHIIGSITKLLVHICNLSFSEGIFSDKMEKKEKLTLMSDNQYYFREGHSSTMVLTDLVNNIVNDIDKLLKYSEARKTKRES